MRKRLFIYIMSSLLAVPYFSSCSDDLAPELPIKPAEETPIVEDDIDVSLLKFGFNLNPKDQSGEIPNADQPLEIYFYADGKELTEEDPEECPLKGYSDVCYLHAGVVSEGTWMYVPTEWTENTDKNRMDRVKENVWKITLSPTIRDWFGSGSTPVTRLGLIIRTADGSIKGIQEDTFVDIQDDKYKGFEPTDGETKAMPKGLDYGINIIDNSTVTLVLYEKPKDGNTHYYDYAYVMGDFNNWTRANDETSKMWYDETEGCWWITLSGLDASREYAFQYYLGKRMGEGEDDYELRIADPYTEKILDSSSDSYIPESTYPSSRRVYPDKGAGIVSTFKIQRDEYPWSAPTVTPDKRNMMIYELLLRDFTETGDLNGAIQKLDYLEDLGVTAIELMPVQEFDGNDSWGYNPCFYFALDKAYGTPEMYKKFIDECHKRNIAVFFDVVYNHATGNHPFAKLYWDSENNKTASNNPWFNVDAPHEASVFHDFNHESQLTRQYIKRSLKYLLEEYHIDGFRFDLTKGFTQTGNNSSYDDSRIAILRDYYNTIQSVRPDAVMICEHWCDANEENMLALAGMLCWNNVNSAYCQAGMGWQNNPTSDFNGMLWKGSFDATQGGWVSYFESHDEERAAYKALAWGDGDLQTNLESRMNSMASLAAFSFTIPGAKMIWQGGELGFDTNLLNYESENQEDGKTDKKPIDWTYLNMPERQHLHEVYSKLLNLRKNEPELFKSCSATNNATYSIDENSWSGGRKIELNGSNGKKLWVIGNFTSSEQTIAAHTVPSGWSEYYDYMDSDPAPDNYTGGQTITLPPHSFLMLTNFPPAN